ncbi:MAG: GTPase Era [Clostridia bacterium]|nr:GTPase Era [Clostridia bacterium]
MSDKIFKSGFVAIVGRPNTGKSTLLNKITGDKLAIVSNKPQTTRNSILTIKTTEDYQLIFVDTPGVHKPKNRLGEFMNRVVTETIADVDAAVLVAECDKAPGETEKELIAQLKAREIPAILVLNKADAASKDAILPVIAQYTALCDFEAVIPMSALKESADKVIDEVLKLIPEGPMYYPEDQMTDVPEKDIASEMIREKILRLFDKEVPHGTAVEIEKFSDGEDLLRIEAAIYCEKNSHKSIIIGKGGEALKRVGSYARSDMEKFFGKKVFLKLWVKVRSDWRNSMSDLKTLGFERK